MGAVQSVQSSERRGPFGSRPVLVACVALWLVAIGSGLGVLVRYSAAPGMAAVAPTVWPVDSHLGRSPTLPTLVMLVHPKCSCSRASLGELAELMTQAAGRVTAHVLFVKPVDTAADWEQGDLKRRAASIAGVTVTIDGAAREAALFGAKTSGQTMVYDAAGHLLFSGGITAARGHAGNNIGRSNALASVNGGAVDARGTPVFGCSLADDGTP